MNDKKKTSEENNDDRHDIFLRSYFFKILRSLMFLSLQIGLYVCFYRYSVIAQIKTDPMTYTTTSSRDLDSQFLTFNTIFISQSTHGLWKALFPESEK